MNPENIRKSLDSYVLNFILFTQFSGAVYIVSFAWAQDFWVSTRLFVGVEGASLAGLAAFITYRQYGIKIEEEEQRNLSLATARVEVLRKISEVGAEKLDWDNVDKRLNALEEGIGSHLPAPQMQEMDRCQICYQVYPKGKYDEHRKSHKGWENERTKR